MIDTHCHLAYPPLVDDIPGVISRAAAAGVDRILLPATDRAQSEAVLALAERHDNLWAMVGVHPHHVLDEPEDGFDWVRDLAAHPRCVAIGEVGLDYYQTPEPVGLHHETQRERFAQFLSLAQELSKPVVLHIRDAHDDALRLAKEYGSGVSMVVHCYTAGVDEARRWLDLGASLSFTNIAAYKSSGAIREALAYVPEESFFIETDAPYLPPVYRRGTSSEPADVAAVLELVMSVRGLTREQAEQITTGNAERFFGLTPQV